MPFAGGYLDQPARWRRAFQRYLPYVIDQHIVRQLNARYSKTWEPTPWPGEEQPADSEGSPQAAATVAHRHAGFIDRIRRRRRSATRGL